MDKEIKNPPTPKPVPVIKTIRKVVRAARKRKQYK